MRRTDLILSIGTAILPIIGALIFLWSDVQTMKETKVNYREIAELKTEVKSQLSTINESIKGLDASVNRLMDERRIKYEKEVSSN